MSDVTRLLESAAQGNREAANALLPLVYDELRKLAAVRMSSERADHSLDATALVHEAYLRLIGDQQFNGRGHFFAAAAEAMRRILVESARKRNAQKRGGEAVRVPLDENQLVAHDLEQVLAVDEALEELARVDREAADLVKLRFFAGLNAADAAAAMGMSVRAAHDRYAVRRTDAAR